METSQPLTDDQVQPPQLKVIHRNIDELVSAALSSNDAALQSHSGTSDETSLRAQQANTFKTFKDLMIKVQRRVSKAVQEVETKLGSGVQAEQVQAIIDAPLQDLPGVAADSELNRVLGRMEQDGKQSFKLRDFISARLPSSIIIPQIFVEDGTAMAPPSQHGNEGHVVTLRPTLRNVWVVQHAYAKLLSHKEDLIKRYLSTAAAAGPGGAGTVSRKFAREYYEVLGLANLPSKDKLGNLLDVKSSTYHGEATGDMMIVLVSLPLDGSHCPVFMEGVTGDAITINVDGSRNGSGSVAHLMLPVTEASIKRLYDAYRALRAATSDQRRASKDKVFAATQPVDAVAELETQLRFGSRDFGSAGEGMASRKRRRMLDDEDERN